MKISSHGFATEMPDDWEDRTMVTLVAPFAPNEFAANAVVTRHFVDATASIEDFAEEQTQMMQASLPGFQVLDRRRTDVNGVYALQQLHNFQTQTGVLQQAQTFVLGDKTIFVITCTAPADNFERHVAAFRQIVENFVFSR